MKKEKNRKMVYLTVKMKDQQIITTTKLPLLLETPTKYEIPVKTNLLICHLNPTQRMKEPGIFTRNILIESAINN